MLCRVNSLKDFVMYILQCAQNNSHVLGRLAARCNSYEWELIFGASIYYTFPSTVGGLIHCSPTILSIKHTTAQQTNIVQFIRVTFKHFLRLMSDHNQC